MKSETIKREGVEIQTLSLIPFMPYKGNVSQYPTNDLKLIYEFVNEKTDESIKELWHHVKSNNSQYVGNLNIVYKVATKGKYVNFYPQYVEQAR